MENIIVNNLDKLESDSSNSASKGAAESLDVEVSGITLPIKPKIFIV